MNVTLGVKLSDKSFLHRARQMWKLPAFLVAFPAVGLALMIALVWDVVELPVRHSIVLYLSSLAVLVISYAWVLLTVRCPSCGARVLWLAVKTKTPGEWFNWVVDLESCPICGSDGSGPQVGQGPDG